MNPEHDHNPNIAATRLAEILSVHTDKRVVVVGTTCTGKSTLQQHIPGTLDMDRVIFPLLTREEEAFVCQDPWTEEIGQTMVRLTKERVSIQPGRPVFGTVVLEADVIVYLAINDSTLQQRCERRSTSFENAKNMQRQIEAEIIAASVPVIHFYLD